MNDIFPKLFSIPVVYFSLPLLIFFQAEIILYLYTLSLILLLIEI